MHRTNHSVPADQADDRCNEPEATEVDEDDLAIWIAGAQLRLVTNRRLGKVTPEWVKQLARHQPWDLWVNSSDRTLQDDGATAGVLPVPDVALRPAVLEIESLQTYGIAADVQRSEKSRSWPHPRSNCSQRLTSGTGSAKGISASKREYSASLERLADLVL